MIGLGSKPIIDLAGQRFGRLTCLNFFGRTTHGKTLWLCRCDCGNRKPVTSNTLRRGTATSCGCYRKERAAAATIAAHTTHGREPRELYERWHSMLDRCNNKNHKSFARYGGRGIRVCDEWRKDFAAFRSWALDSGFSPELTLERRENNAGYSPSNCTWATSKQQARNRKSTLLITINGATKCVAQFAEEYGVLPSTLARRWNRGIRGEALFTPGRIS